MRIHEDRIEVRLAAVAGFACERLRGAECLRIDHWHLIWLPDQKGGALAGYSCREEMVPSLASAPQAVPESVVGRAVRSPLRGWGFV